MSSSKEINKKWLVIGACPLLFIMVLPSVLLLAKIAIGLIMFSVAAIAAKISSRTISSVLKDEQVDQNQATQQTTQSKITNLAIGLVSIFAGGLSLFIIGQVGLAAACAAITASVLYKCFEDEEIGKNISDKLDKAADNTTNFIVDNVAKLIPQERNI